MDRDIDEQLECSFDTHILHSLELDSFIPQFSFSPPPPPPPS